ncbi:GntR family transcriptional regulator [Amycolatopsis rubida]|uniref:DNA-binding transcriptional regulator, GntR family n=1 Tax=Amycolatopsis rubida TaxID=112413 RepID=A0A1I6A2W1_9PSEU|nr:MULTISPECIES: GntR family transcriptional regulator [Amycolatopsis]MYW89677.1 FCD domain-containing protein [Amycolatopsis rubida]NEC54653.1 GntR family transcriptional regulator [Amycolatopsis rubida]OAP23539.1 putative HTH-type transcriptional regulator YdfH [Amycolatopsis sp. M39]SFQ63064.1 DNA-binding transcriptional regulator, GntR family [Amycolatopsis rubida]
MKALKPAADRAYELTKELVLTGELPGGHLFSEGEIAERLGVSRTPVREAFLRLQVEGLLNLIPKRGAIVVPITPGEAEDVLEAREAVESAAVQRLGRRPELIPAALDRLRAVLAAQRQHAEAGDVPAFAEADALFHRMIVEAGGNTLLLGFYTTLADRQRRMNVHALAPIPARLPQVVDEHEELLNIIAEAETKAAAFAPALRAHLDSVHRR